MENAEPDWLTAHREKHPEDFEPRSSRRGGFRPGVSGNPAGRPKGSKNRKTQLAEELQKDGSELARVIKEAALAVVQAREQRTAIVPGWKAFSEALDELGKIAGTIFRPPNSSKPIKAQQQMDGTINISFPNMASFREWATTPRV